MKVDVETSGLTVVVTATRTEGASLRVRLCEVPGGGLEAIVTTEGERLAQLRVTPGPSGDD